MPFVPDIELGSSHEPRNPEREAPYDNRPDKDRWWALFFTMLGTRQAAVVDMFIGQLQQLVPDRWDEKKGCWRGNQEDTRAMFGMIQSMKPKTVAQAALAAQLVALHFNTMKLAAGISSYSMGDARTAATIARCTKAYAEGMLALQKLQGKARKSKQTITVETHHHHHQHIHYETGGSPINGGQAQGTERGAIVQCATLPSPDEAGHLLPGRSHAGKACLPVPRRGQGKRGTEGRS